MPPPLLCSSDPTTSRTACRSSRMAVLFASSSATGNDRVYQVGAGHWVQPGVTTANLVLDDLEKHLTEKGAE